MSIAANNVVGAAAEVDELGELAATIPVALRVDHESKVRRKYKGSPVSRNSRELLPIAQHFSKIDVAVIQG